MTMWIDAQLSPDIAVWIKDNTGVNAISLRGLGLRDSEDEEIFRSAREADAVVMAKDSDFVLLLERNGPPPKSFY
jgi:predicted nuclease of predicted toxin-antitoxin system